MANPCSRCVAVASVCPHGRRMGRLRRPSEMQLLVAPSYEDLPPNKRLKGTRNDIDAMKEILQSNPFNKKDIQVLEGKNATKANILAKFAYAASTLPYGGLFLFYFTGHGTKLADHLDEGIVLADVTQQKIRDQDPSVFLTGEDLRTPLETMTQRGVGIILIFDCCFSGHVYRDLSLQNTAYNVGCSKQITMSDLDPVEQDVHDTPLPTSQPARTFTRHGFIPKKGDKLYHLSACSSLEVAEEVFDEGKFRGLLTLCLQKALQSIRTIPISKVTFRSMLRLIKQELAKRNQEWLQTPQYEGEDMMLLFQNKLGQRDAAVYDINWVSDDGRSVGIPAGHLQLLDHGTYYVYKATATGDFLQSNRSELYKGSIDVGVNDVGTTSSVGHWLTLGKATNSMIGCVCRRVGLGSVRSNVTLVSKSIESQCVTDLKEQLEGQKMFNVNASEESPATPGRDDILITEEDYSGYDGCTRNIGASAWFVRQCRKVILPPITVNEPSVVAVNLAKVTRYKIALKQCSEVVNNLAVTISVHKLESVEPYDKGTSSYGERIKEGLLTRELYSTGTNSHPVFKSHKVTEGRIQPESGDALVWQIKNNESFAVHICVLLYCLDGSVIVLYPPKKGHTIELGAGETYEDMYRTYIPERALRKFTCPDPQSPEPREGEDSLVLYATNAPSDFSPLVQEAISLDTYAHKDSETNMDSYLDKFKTAMIARNIIDENESNAPNKWLVVRRPYVITLE